ncbi:hypothetical protein LTR99_000221 [Exophiala xenobiotica]|uniref:Uncharacterized protein n=1 Tax=Vermiconidia calcicola TaxID=1690605 RepID=A0AAV9PW87_9PEZI|nr:hypothetical protein H2202_010911 [Exophiala xenobiotica]KAK5529971.1 hypothetical protein LTR25_009214 [Vermiconidia calcicola]KAK5547290.1 hypothetical protein LTR23_002509 [Chaetothyriales sp. CCFEE 6169]KAK5197416.1 hypothetical protein LTR92_003355 [Exophiala xenobiotica]KAK5213782.1 hypothetical protein LTR41_001362 [Exophiala xenobiotica]
MVAMYTIAGRQVGSHWLAMATLGAAFGIPWAMTRGGSSKKSTTPPINAGSKDEEKFIQEFLQQVEQEGKADKISGKEAH